MASQLKSDALRELDTIPAVLHGFGSGDLDVVGAARAKADAVYRGLLEKRGVSGSEESRAGFDLNARNIGITAGLADNMGAAVTSRAQGLDQLSARLATAATAKDRKSGVEGKREADRVDLGGRRIIKKKQTKQYITHQTTNDIH